MCFLAQIHYDNEPRVPYLPSKEMKNESFISSKAEKCETVLNLAK